MSSWGALIPRSRSCRLKLFLAVPQASEIVWPDVVEIKSIQQAIPIEDLELGLACDHESGLYLMDGKIWVPTDTLATLRILVSVSTGKTWMKISNHSLRNVYIV